ncbi:MAG: 30S ribosomal protein S7 [Gammaproteobacteria bacterium RIFCSPHIGHO2_12_FULL_37_34]|nr:MAG: 30S ribosomal protein S7 [Gammaproteobacteria bacterium RIFCSPHIGHO2_12_FULL_37_34]
MPRRKAAVKRETLPDPLYGSDQVSKFINVIMRAGKKSIAEKIVYRALNNLTERLKKEGKGDKGDDHGDSSRGGRKSVVIKSKGSVSGHDDALELLMKVLSNVAPTVEVKSRRVGGATYQVPIEVALDRGHALAMRWVVQAAKGRSEKTMALRLAAEMYEAYLGRGTSIKMRDDVHRMAKANQAFAHYRW